MISNMWLDKNNGKITDGETLKADRDGLFARLRNGKISFIYRPYLKTGERIKMTIGAYPAMSLKDARTKVAELNEYVAEGFDPRLKVKAKQLRNMTAPTIDNLFNIWYERQVADKVVNAPKHLRTYELHVQKKFGQIPYEDLERSTLAQFLIAKAAVVPEVAKVLLGDLRRCFDYHLLSGTITRDNILSGIEAKSLGIVKGQRTRVLNDGDIRLLYRVMRHIGMNDKNVAIVELLLFYGCRGGELRNTKRDWLDFDAMTWTVPPEFHKTGAKTKMPIIRPILPEMRHLWDTLLGFSKIDYLCVAMENKSTQKTSQMSAGALENLPRQLQQRVRNKKFVDETGELIDWEHWSVHDLRRTARSYWSDLGDWAICEKMLGHRLPGEADVYDRNTYTNTMTTIYRKWWSIMKALETGDTNVVPLNRKRVV